MKTSQHTTSTITITVEPGDGFDIRQDRLSGRHLISIHDGTQDIRIHVPDTMFVRAGKALVNGRNRP